MRPAALLDQLVELARAAGFEVREIGSTAAGEGEAAPASGSCRLRGRIWVLLARGDSDDQRIDAVARALTTHAGDFLETRYLAPAVRARLGGDRERS